MEKHDFKAIPGEEGQNRSLNDPYNSVATDGETSREHELDMMYKYVQAGRMKQGIKCLFFYLMVVDDHMEKLATIMRGMERLGYVPP